MTKRGKSTSVTVPQLAMLLGIGGKIGAGKDTVANYLRDTRGYQVMSMAEPLKRACQALFLFTDEQMFGTQEQKATVDDRWGCSPRKALQFLGTDLLRDHLDEIMPGMGANVFCQRFRLWYQEQRRLNPQICVVVPDIRFRNELDMIHELGGQTIYLHRDHALPVQESAHISEQSIDSAVFHYTIGNTSTIPDLHEQVEIAMTFFEQKTAGV